MNGTSIMVSTAGIQSSNPQPLRRGDKEFPLLNVEQIWIIINYSIMKLLWASVAFGTSKHSNVFWNWIFFYHFERICLDEHGLSEGTVRRFCHADALPGQSLNDSPVVQVVEVRVGVQVRQGHAVQLGIGQGTNDVRL